MSNFDNNTSLSIGFITGGSIVGLILCKRINIIKRKYINLKMLYKDIDTELIMKKESLKSSINQFESSEIRYNELKKSFEKIQNINTSLNSDLKSMENRINDSQNYRSEINSLVENALRSPNARGINLLYNKIFYIYIFIFVA
jgi:predicted nuclease with TOPRIM domain